MEAEAIHTWGSWVHAASTIFQALLACTIAMIPVIWATVRALNALDKQQALTTQRVEQLENRLADGSAKLAKLPQLTERISRLELQLEVRPPAGPAPP